ncbi:MAG: hypothetical protein IT379_26130, partial [Deltaproteobacteria bacterium]|nr:hypothetical protein [Deltaproteobacteria bacterium]
MRSAALAIVLAACTRTVSLDPPDSAGVETGVPPPPGDSGSPGGDAAGSIDAKCDLGAPV